MTDGSISPKVVRDFETHCQTYFMNAKDGVADDLKVTKILGCFENALVADWASTERERLAKLSFEDFMKEFRERWLPYNWEQMIRVQMLGTHLDPAKHRFETWAAQIMSHNVSLRNTPLFMTDDRLRTQLEIMLDVELQTLARSQKVSEITDLHKWMTQIKEIDNQRQIHLKRMEQFFDAAASRAAKRQNTGQNTSQYRAPRTSGSFQQGCNNQTRTAPASASTTSTTYPPRLTDEERCLLHDHEGCLKCREFYIGHRANACTVTLSGKDYRTRTMQDALRAKSLRGNGTWPAPVAATIEPTEATKPSELVAAVFPHNAPITADGSVTEDSDSSIASVSDKTPLKGKHFIWTCRIDNAIDQVSVKARALIDSGAHMVLIRPDLVKRLNLRSHPLATPERVDVALGSANHIEHLTHFVIILPSSLDSHFTSQPL